MARPWMPLYVADYLADTGHLSAAEHGAYMLLIMHYWTNGGLPDDERRLARICRMSDEEWARSRDELAAFFDGEWKHTRMENELRRRRAGLTWGVLPDQNQLPAHWRELRSRIFARDDFTCSYCGQRGGKLECDHIIPRARGGSNEPGNLTTACYDCNRSKGAMTILEWRQ